MDDATGGKALGSSDIAPDGRREYIERYKGMLDPINRPIAKITAVGSNRIAMDFNRD